jgi:hypothetical protein
MLLHAYAIFVTLRKVGTSSRFARVLETCWESLELGAIKMEAI